MRAKAALASLVLALSTLSIPTGVDAALEERKCLAQNIYFESKNTTVQDQTAVAYVTLNRVKSKEYPDTICKVVYQKNQFSWTSHPAVIREPKAYREAIRIADLVMDEEVPDVSNGAISFHEKSVKPNWARKMDVSLKTRVHIYYKKREKA